LKSRIYYSKLDRQLNLLVDNYQLVSFDRDSIKPIILSGSPNVISVFWQDSITFYMKTNAILEKKAPVISAVSIYETGQDYAKISWKNRRA